ncbi:hypothetical protein E4631_10930 [Hymenobacter sp. UV11]|uniref:hypothetical protein n=1 Tax=Hymenobacter sp. UV11 TaxID=1849735 RepID=UPI00105E9CB0|nr:hypothetical protein [Hymenobacter sp. UV11]TDN40467.1 hypothetical protein A8B98_13625 [Hymenobacter sp. UV11]TFZ66523.1 hypothetical protein E4631_10930 [Hymenobacter sp. UV11]
MKTSTTLLLAALLVLLASLTAYNMALRAEYRSGTYKDPLRNYQTLALRNFDAVRVPSASGLNVKIVAGPFGVHVGKQAAAYVRITQQGQQLRVALAYPQQPEPLGRGETVIISCPQLAALTIEGTYSVAGKPQFNQLQAGGTVLVQGFRQDSLALRQDQSNQIRLAGNTLNQLRALVGTQAGSSPELEIGPDNRIQAASLTVNHQGRLDLKTVIPHLRYHFSDSATAVFSGPATRRLNAE